MHFDSEDRLRLLLGVALGVILVAGTVDLILDRPDRWTSPHVLFEVSIVVGALAMTVGLWHGWWRSTRSLTELNRSLAERERERDAWRRSAEQALEGLGRAIHAQFDAWGLTPSERDVALLLLKGRSHKAIGRETGRSAQTVRQHATAIYRKADLAGRAELSAFFLEDLMLPDGPDPERPPS